METGRVCTDYFAPNFAYRLELPYRRFAQNIVSKRLGLTQHKFVFFPQAVDDQKMYIIVVVDELQAPLRTTKKEEKKNDGAVGPAPSD